MYNSLQPFFSIIIPVYNRANILGKTLFSLLNQVYSNYEVIIVDDGSSDRPDEVINEYANPRVSIYKILNSERGAARNRGLQYAKGMYVNFFDSDDIFLPCLEQLQKFIKSRNEPYVVYGGIEHIDTHQQAIKTENLPYNSFTENLLHNNFLACGSVFLKREVALKYPFHTDRRLSSAEDWELWLRIHTKYEFIEFPEKIFLQVHHKGRSISTINAGKIKDRDYYFASLVLDNSAMCNRYGKKAINLFVADRYTFIGLTCIENGYYGEAYHFWKKAFQTSFLVVKRKRFWAVLKKLIIG